MQQVLCYDFKPGVRSFDMMVPELALFMTVGTERNQPILVFKADQAQPLEKRTFFVVRCGATLDNGDRMAFLGSYQRFWKTFFVFEYRPGNGNGDEDRR